MIKGGAFLVLKYSRQRESIKEYLMTRKDHPTADMVYINVKKEFPNISLGTVYRNLTLLSDIGEILKLDMGDGADHFDAKIIPHNHFVCTECGNVLDLEIELEIDSSACKDFNGTIDGHVIYFYGKCGICMRKS